SNAAGGDIVCGYMTNPGSLSSTMDTSGLKYNSVEARVRRTAQKNGSLRLFFGAVLGKATQDLAATAIATYEGDGNIAAFNFSTSGATNSKLLPFALDIASWNNCVSGTGPDNWNYNPATGAYAAGSDGVKEVNLYPTKGITPGNFGTVDLGLHNNSTS